MQRIILNLDPELLSDCQSFEETLVTAIAGYKQGKNVSYLPREIKRFVQSRRIVAGRIFHFVPGHGILQSKERAKK